MCLTLIELAAFKPFPLPPASPPSEVSFALPLPLFLGAMVDAACIQVRGGGKKSGREVEEQMLAWMEEVDSSPDSIVS